MSDQDHSISMGEQSAKDLVTGDELSMLLGTKIGGAAKSPFMGPDPANIEPFNPNVAQTPSKKRQRVVPYNFRRPDRVSKEQIHSLYLLHDNFARNVSSNLGLMLRAITEVTLVSIEQQSHLEYLYRLPDPTAIFKLDLSPLQGLAVLELNLSIAFPVIDRQLGGLGQPLNKQRPLTDLEQKILEGFLKVVIGDLHAAWEPIIDMEFSIAGWETRPQLLQVAAPNEVVLAVMFEIRIDDVRGAMSFCIPAITLEPIIHRFNQASFSQIQSVSPEQTHAILRNVSGMSVPLAAELHGTKVTVEDLMSLVPGDIVRLDRRASESIEISIWDAIKFSGDLVSIENRLGVRLHSLVKPGQSEAR
jgi:flagellar motor switch protein FliM